jgi:glyoxylase-like metal-dependent hydrolase (beta-lactamase superfamily II)
LRHPQAPIAVNQRFSDTFAFGDLKVQFVFSCDLVKRGEEYLLWDTGDSMSAPNVAPKVSVVDQLAKLNVKPDQIKYVGISHYHGDHTGQVASFPKALLLIGKNEWDAIAAPSPAAGVNHAPFESWKKGESKVEPLANDKDVWGDGTVVVLTTPGHTPGHRSLMVKLPQSGTFIIGGDAVHFRENYESNGVPRFTTGRRPSRRSTVSRSSSRTRKARSSFDTMRVTSRSCLPFPRERVESHRAAAFPRERVESHRAAAFPRERVDSHRAAAFPRERVDSHRAAAFPRERVDSHRAAASGGSALTHTALPLPARAR